MLLHVHCEVSDRPAPPQPEQGQKTGGGGREMRLLEVRRGGSVSGANQGYWFEWREAKRCLTRSRKLTSIF